MFVLVPCIGVVRDSQLSAKGLKIKAYLFFSGVDVYFLIILRCNAHIQWNPTIFRSEDRRRELDLIKLICLGPI